MSSLKVLNSFIEPFVERSISQTTAEIQNKEKSGQKVSLAESLGQSISDKSLLRDQLVNVLLGGMDTIAANLSWLFYELSYHPDVYARLRKEVLDTLGTDGKEPTYEDLKSMTYLRNCLNEGIKFTFFL